MKRRLRVLLAASVLLLCGCAGRTRTETSQWFTYSLPDSMQQTDEGGLYTDGSVRLDIREDEQHCTPAVYLAELAEKTAEIAAFDVNGLTGASLTAEADGISMLYAVVGCDGRLLSFEAYAEDSDEVRRAEKLLGRITKTVQYTGTAPHAEPFHSSQITVQYPDVLAPSFQNAGEQDSVLGLTFVNAQDAAERSCQLMIAAENSTGEPAAVLQQLQARLEQTGLYAAFETCTEPVLGREAAVLHYTDTDGIAAHSEACFTENGRLITVTMTVPADDAAADRFKALLGQITLEVL